MKKTLLLVAVTTLLAGPCWAQDSSRPTLGRQYNPVTPDPIQFVPQPVPPRGIYPNLAYTGAPLGYDHKVRRHRRHEDRR